MSSRKEEFRSLETSYGVPRLTAMRIHMTSPEHNMLGRSIQEGHNQDATVFITDGSGIVVVRSSDDPKGIYRAPSWRIPSFETVEEVVHRMSSQEIGLRVEFERYVVRSIAGFFSKGEETGWISHVFRVEPVRGNLEVQDGAEVIRARWLSQKDIATKYRRRMLSSASGEMKYRAYLTDVALKELGRSGRR
jgi:ADP-ribose pyrophosphatase YjhB (NUDIX family)